jgi:hypothetical protein
VTPRPPKMRSFRNNAGFIHHEIEEAYVAG